MRKQLHGLGYKRDQFGLTNLDLHDVARDVYLVKGNPINDQTDMRLHSCYSYALSVCHVLCSTVRFANIDRLKANYSARQATSHLV
jgi:hypothetical protein